jgi:hypothetical protein
MTTGGVPSIIEDLLLDDYRIPEGKGVNLRKILWVRMCLLNSGIMIGRSLNSSTS